MRSIWSGHLKIVMLGANMQSWRDLCVKLIEPGLYLSLQLHSLHWICQSYYGRYFSNYSFRWMFYLVCMFTISSEMSTLIEFLTNHINMLSRSFTRLNYRTSWIYFAPLFCSLDSMKHKNNMDTTGHDNTSISQKLGYWYVENAFVFL